MEAQCSPCAVTAGPDGGTGTHRSPVTSIPAPCHRSRKARLTAAALSLAGAAWIGVTALLPRFQQLADAEGSGGPYCGGRPRPLPAPWVCRRHVPQLQTDGWRRRQTKPCATAHLHSFPCSLWTNRALPFSRLTSHQLSPQARRSRPDGPTRAVRAVRRIPCRRRSRRLSVPGPC